MSFVSSTGRLYGVEGNTDLETDVWVPLSINLQGNAGTTTVLDAGAEPWRSYRVRARLP